MSESALAETPAAFKEQREFLECLGGCNAIHFFESRGMEPGEVLLAYVNWLVGNPEGDFMAFMGAFGAQECCYDCRKPQ